MKNLSMFLQLAKVDEAKREVYGIATAEVLDKDGEIFDYESSKPYFKNWSDEISKATDGKSLGNVREMHRDSAVGKLIAMTFDDENKRIEVGAKIVDDAAWEKCAQGVYTGFSIGGKYIKVWKDAAATRFTANPAEISVVDNPCVPTAHFTAVKADGSTEVRKFAPASNPQSGSQTAKKTQTVKKDMYSVSNLAALLQSAVYLQMDATYEAEYEADDSEIPAELKDWITTGADILARMTEEELSELTARMKAVNAEFEKKGAKYSAETKAHHAAINKCMGKIAKAAAEAKDHCDALMGKDDDAAMMAGKNSGANPEITIGGQPTMLEANEKQTLEKAQTDSTAALSKIAEVEKKVEGLATKEEVNSGFTKLAEVLHKMAEKLSVPSQTVARTVVPTVTVTKDGAPATEEKDPLKAAMKTAMSHPKPAFDYLRQ